MVNKQLQYTYCPISQDVKAIAKFGELIQYDMRNIFLENHTQNVVEKLSPGLFLKNQN